MSRKILKTEENKMQNRLHILWTSDNVLTAEHMVMLYAPKTMEFKLWDEVTIIIWGASSKLVAENSHIQELVREAQKAGVKFSACSMCAQELGTTKALQDLDVELIAWGKPLTELIKNRSNLITI